MFSVPITIPLRLPDRVDRLVSSVEIDNIVKVVCLLDKRVDFDVECNELYGYTPLTELLLIDGRKLPVCEPADAIIAYLDAYRQIEDFYNTPIPIDIGFDPGSPEGDRGVVIPLFPDRRPCVSSEGSTPD